ncbi:hypothetical protein QQS21_000485 [Conoideocrella luteorostrata]|uniref:Peptidase S8/S53 domain-containing protein n=1 Tax=Conoideocrella luteorostrata TaxID=1105319 RepID=A0AAJ0D136_9HYPO|nr:hypothetical protein QQS21_000485 [Conoideocrella luteorostrata]
MAFSFPQRNDEMSDAIREATNQNILVFAGASDRYHVGNPVGYPASDHNAIGVYPCRADGEPSTTVAREAERNIMTLGDGVDAAFLEGQQRRFSGSSPATAILAGVAGLLITCSVIAPSLSASVGQEYQREQSLWMLLRTQKGMEAILKNTMATQWASLERPKHYYVRPWFLFSTPREGQETIHHLRTISRRILESLEAAVGTG